MLGVWMSPAWENTHHRIQEDLPEVVVVVGGVVVGGGDEAPEIMAVGDEHEDSLDQSIQTLATWRRADNQLTLLEDPRRLSALAGQTNPVALVLNSRVLARWNPRGCSRAGTDE